MCICNLDPSYFLCGGHKRRVSVIWIFRITSSAEVTNDVYSQYGSFVSPPLRRLWILRGEDLHRMLDRCQRVMKLRSQA